MKFLLDTNVLISMFKNQHGIRESILKVGFNQCAVSELTLAELYVGVFKGKNLKQVREVQFVVEHFEILPDSPALETYARIRASLELQGMKIDTMDCLIGGTAVYHDLIMVTHNADHFNRIPGLKVVDWEK